MWLHHLLFVLLMFTFSALGSVCKSNGNQEKKFKVYLQETNWYAAMLKCSSNDMALATIQSLQEQQMITQELKLNGGTFRKWWIGGSDLHDEGNYLWFSTGEPISYWFDYRRPDNHRPLDETEHCMEIVKEYPNYFYWNDYFCSSTRPFVCQYYE